MAEEKKQISSMSTENRVFNPPKSLVERAWIKSRAQYDEMYQRSIKDPDGFWGEVAGEFEWFKKWDKVNQENYGEADIKWFVGGKTNITVNALDRHVKAGKGNQTAILWEGDSPENSKALTYQWIYDNVNKAANVLKAHGVKKGDRVAVYLPMIPELVVLSLACARIGAIHSIVFGGFSADSLRDRILDAGCEILLTADGGFRGARDVPLKGIADQALLSCPNVKRVVMVKHTGKDCNFVAGRDVWYHDEMAKVAAYCEPEQMDAEDPLFMLYTSGSTGKPKGVVHTVGGYMVFAATTFKYIFDYHPGDVWWCTADIGWVTGHSYIMYAPLLNGATEVMFEGVPTYPNPGRFWEVVEKYKVTQFYTAPTAIRALMREGVQYVTPYKLDTLRLLGTVGEPINPEAWMWYWENIGKKRCPVVDTWWQTETGGILITPLPAAIPQKPGSATLPFFGVIPIVLDPTGGKELQGETTGVLAIKEPWPGQMRGVYGDPGRFKDTYFVQYPGYYFTGDGCRRDKDGYYWITGRVDDVINVSGHRLGTAEIESALVLHKSVAEAAVVGAVDDITGWSVYAFVILKAGQQPSPELQKELVAMVRKEISPIATPKYIQFASGLPKTRSGKIMRRILRKIVEKTPDQIGDTSTLADPTVVTELVKNALVK